MDKLIIKPNKYSGPTSVISIRIPNELIAQLDSISSLTKKSRNKLILTMLEFSLANTEIVDQ